MSRLHCGILAVGLTVIIGNVAAAQSVWHTDLNEARREAERLNRPILCHFGAGWCAPCQKMEKSVLNQPAVVRELKANVVAMKVDCTEHTELAHRFGVEQFPTDVFIEPSGQVLIVSTGFQPQDDYLALIDRATRRYADVLASRATKLPSTLATVPNPAQALKPSAPLVMMEGYCPVTLQRTRKWVKGNSDFHCEFKGQTYRFTSAEARDRFQQSPDKYAPQFLGCDPVVIWATDRAMPGTIEWGAYYDQRLYLFSSADNRRKFKESPDKFISARVVLNVDQIESVIR